MDFYPGKDKEGFFSLRVLWVLGFLIVLILFLAYFFYSLQPVSAEVADGSFKFKIMKGEGLKDIGGRLSQENLIRSITVFKLYVLLTGNAQNFQPGLYDLSPRMSVPGIVRELTAAGRNEVLVTIPEGFAAKDIDTILQKNGVLAGSIQEYPFNQLVDRYPYLAGVQSMEGFLFPDTYRFNLDSPVETVLSTFLDNFNRKGWVKLTGFKNWYDYLTLASYLEREVPEFEDRQIVAGIIMKRLRLGIPLQIDATISYAKCKGELKNCPEIKISRDDLRLPSPYNTYQRLGWTPTPISNPGEAALKAAVSPKTSPYLYYLSVPKTNRTIFSKTLEEHNLNRAKYL